MIKHTSFKEKGHLFEVYLDRVHGQNSFVIQVFKGGTTQKVREDRLPLEFEPRCGIDVTDSNALAAKLEEIVQTLL